MAKTGKQKKARNFEEEYNEVLNGFVPSPYTQGNHQQWTAPGDFLLSFPCIKKPHLVQLQQVPPSSILKI
ncbi:MAG: hypothetical protein IPP25_12495 [Saprospiraceae bacterium]|nr:hypothetical protein [Candidatus Opimibacter skivensis]